MTGRPIEDYGADVRVRLPGFPRWRIDPVRLDHLVAALLTVLAELEVWLGGGQHGLAA
jgi:hypothetical protein